MASQVIQQTRSVGCDARLVLVTQNPEDAPLGSGEYAITPPAKIRRLSPPVQSGRRLPVGSQGIRVDADGQFTAPDPLFREFWRASTTPVMIAAEAWKDYTKYWLKPHLNRLTSTPRHCKAGAVLDHVVAEWARLEGLQASQSAKPFPHLDHHSFDVLVAAFRSFRDRPEMFQFQADAHHAAAVKALEALFTQVFEEQIDSMDIRNTQQLEQMFEEVSAAEDLRYDRNSSAGHPFDKRSDPKVRQRSYRLLERMVSVNHPTIAPMQTLAKASLHHLRVSLNAMQEESNRDREQRQQQQQAQPQPNLLKKFFPL